MSDKGASALKVDTMVGEEVAKASPNNNTQYGNAATKSPAVPKVTLRLAELSTPGHIRAEKKVSIRNQMTDQLGFRKHPKKKTSVHV